jgi:hypothetical protein
MFLFLAPWNVDLPQRPVPGCRGLAGGSVAINKCPIISAEPPTLSYLRPTLSYPYSRLDLGKTILPITITSHRLSHPPTHHSSHPILAQPSTKHRNHAKQVAPGF